MYPAAGLAGLIELIHQFCYKGRVETLSLFGVIMKTKNITVDLGPEHLNILAMAMDRFSCEVPVDHVLATPVLELMLFFNDLADEVDAEMELDPVLSEEDNLIVVDFTPKAG